MLEQSGTNFDPILLKVFINILGAYPVGTLLKFDTGEMGIVIGQSAGTNKTKPRVQLLVADPVERYKKGRHCGSLGIRQADRGVSAHDYREYASG